MKVNTHHKAETDYANYFSNMDLTNGFYFSYGVDLTSPIQTWFEEKAADAESDGIYPAKLDYDDTFVFNTTLMQPLIFTCDVYEFFLPIVYGFVRQKNLMLEEREISVGIISRRSRLNYGPRYLRRGLNSDGDCANEVLTEQFVYELNPFNHKEFCLSSFCMVIYTNCSSEFPKLRASIPFYWGHTNILSPRPEIVTFQDRDKDYYMTCHHFANLQKKYGKL